MEHRIMAKTLDTCQQLKDGTFETLASQKHSNEKVMANTYKRCSCKRTFELAAAKVKAPGMKQKEDRLLAMCIR